MSSFSIDAVLGNVFRQAVAAGVLVGKVAAGIALFGRVAGHPDMLGGKAAARAHEAALLRQHHGRGLDQELVAGRIADAVLLVGIDDLPVAPGAPVGLARRVALACQHPARRIEHVAVGIVVAPRARHELVLGDGVALAVDHHVQASVEEVLVRRAAQALGDHAAPGIRLAGRDRRRLDDAGQLGLELDGAVLIEVPVEAVIVVADGREERDDEAARAAHLEGVVAELVVLPEDAVVLLMHADGVLHHHGLAEIVGGRHVEIVDVAEAVAAELERVGELAEPVFAGVECALPEVVGGRVGIRARPSR